MVKKGISPSSIIAVTFTNKSAREMKARLRGMMSRSEMRGMVVSTFHSLGNRILQKEIHLLPGYRTPFSILTPDDGLNIFGEIYRNLKMDATEVKEDGITFHISLAKNSGLDPAEYAERRRLKFPPEIFAEIYQQYHRHLHSLNAVDFDDLILLPRKVFKYNPDVLARYRRKHRYFLVDEFQDTNPAQYHLLLDLVGPDQNICVVGDDDQSIYGWRGADLNIILGFQNDFPTAKVVRLEYNYRSTETILEAANAVIVNNSQRVDKRLKATGAIGSPIRAMVGADEVREGELVADRIQSMIIRQKRKPGEFAILYRTNFQSRIFEEELRKRNIPLHVVGGYKFFDRREVKDMISYLRYLANPRDEISLKRIINRPRRGIGEATLQKINEYILTFEESDRPDFEQVIQDMMETPGLIQGIKADSVAALREFLEFVEHYRKQFSHSSKMSPVLGGMIKDLKWENEFMRDGDQENTIRARILNLSELVNMLSYMEANWESPEKPTLFSFLAQIAMQSGDQDEDENADSRVQLLTLHLSKGLEFPVVFLCGLEEGIFPAGRSLDEAENESQALAEERRLFYVGITRARQELFFTCSRSRRRFGEVLDVEPSRFFDEVPEAFLEWIVQEDAKDAEALQIAAEEDFLSGLSAMRDEEEDEEGSEEEESV